MDYRLRPIGSDWTEPHTKPRSGSQFKSSWSDTTGLLYREVGMLGGRGPVIIQVDIREGDLRLDGELRANAKTGNFPGAIVTFDTKDGPLRFATDKYGSLPFNPKMRVLWQHNVRAIALALEALRLVDRYGVSNRHQQYTGWRAIEANGHQAGAFDGSAGRAVRWLILKAGEGRMAGEAPDLLVELEKLPQDAGDRAKLAEARELMVKAGMVR